MCEEERTKEWGWDGGGSPFEGRRGDLTVRD